MQGGQHAGLVVDIVKGGGDKFFSASFDDTVRKLTAASGFE